MRFYKKEYEHIKGLEEREKAIKSNKKKATSALITSSFTPSPKNLVKVDMTKESLQDTLIALVTHDQQPMSKLSSAPFKQLIGQMAGQLGVSLDRESIRNLTTRKYREVVKALSEEVYKKLSFLKVKLMYLVRDCNLVCRGI